MPRLSVCLKRKRQRPPWSPLGPRAGADASASDIPSLSFLFLLLLPAFAFAQTQVTLPLSGYYRPGRYLPVAFTVSTTANSRLAIRSDSAVPTIIQLPEGRAQGVAPFLPLRRMREARWQIESGGKTSSSAAVAATWRELALDERLVGFADSVEPAIGPKLFPDLKIIPAQIEGEQILSSPIAAWDCLDAIVLPSASGLDDAKLAQFLASGTAIAIHSPDAPDHRWPWMRVDDYWVLQYRPKGPRVADWYPDALIPAQGWHAAWPAPLRYRVILYAVGFCILALAATLLPRRYAVLAIIALSAVTVSALALWWRGRSAVLERGGRVIVMSDRLTQQDTWSWRASAAPAADTVAWSGMLRPLFEQPRQDQMMKLSLQCQEDGQPVAFDCTTTAYNVAFMSRTVAPGKPKVDAQPDPRSPLTLLARRVYLARDDNELGIVPGSASDSLSNQWYGALLIRPAPTAPKPAPSLDRLG